MSLRKYIGAFVLAMTLIPGLVLAEEKRGTVSSYDPESRMIVVKGKDWEQKAKVSSAVAKEKADILKEGTKVTVDFEDRGGGDVRVKSISPR